MGIYYGCRLCTEEIFIISELSRQINIILPPLVKSNLPDRSELIDILRLNTSNFIDTQNYIVPQGIIIENEHIVEIITWSQMVDHSEFWPLHPSIGGLRHLKKINEFFLPEGFEFLPDIERYALLEILHNVFFEESDDGCEIIINNGHITEINLRYVYLHKVPDSIGNLEYLKKLNFHNARVYSIPETIGMLRSLEHLEFSIYSFHSLPNSFGNLTQLKYFRLDQREATKGSILKELYIPDTAKNLLNLETLILTRNQIKEIPEFIAFLGQLKKLDLSRNPIEMIPSFMFDLPVGIEIIFDINAMGKLKLDEGFERIVDKIQKNRRLGWLEVHHPRLSQWASRLDEICMETIKKTPEQGETAKFVLDLLKNVSIVNCNGNMGILK